MSKFTKCIGFSMSFKNSLLNIPDEIATQRWLFWIFVCYCLISVTGSLVTVILGVMGIFAYLLKFFEKERFKLNKTELNIVVIILSYIFISFIFSLIRPNRYDAIEFAINNLTFIILFALLPVVRAFSKPEWIKFIYYAISLGLILCGITVLFQVLLFDTVRPHALVANPLVLSTVVAGFSLLSLNKCLENFDRESYFHFTAFFLACFIVFITGSRAASIGLFFSSTLLILFYRKTLLKNFKIVIQNLYILFLFSIVIYELLLGQSGFEHVIARFDVIDTLSEYIVGSGNDSSISARLKMVEGGWIAFKNAPWTGYGRQNIMAVSSDILNNNFTNFSHLHNAFLTEMVSSGILGLITFLAISGLPIYITWNTQLEIRVLAFVWTVCWFVIIMTGIGFYHDIMIIYFILVILFFSIITNFDKNSQT